MSSKSSQYNIEQISISQIEPWEEVNVRRRQVKAYVNGLVESIRRVGLLEPIIVQEQQNGKYRIIIGQRRFYAFQELANEDPKKWGRIPATVRHLDKAKATIASMIENVQRRDIAVHDKAITCKFLLDRF
jgi:ParB family chromosome partitioning protein